MRQQKWMRPQFKVNVYLERYKPYALAPQSIFNPAFVGLAFLSEKNCCFWNKLFLKFFQKHFFFISEITPQDTYPTFSKFFFLHSYSSSIFSRTIMKPKPHLFENCNLTVF